MVKPPIARITPLIAATVLFAAAAPVFWPGAVAGPALSGSVTVASMGVNVTVDHHYALTSVRTELANPTDTLQGRQVSFAYSDFAFVTRLAIEVAGSIYESSVEDAEQARSDYNATTAAGYSAALLESRDTKTLAITVGVPANSTLVVHLAFEQMVHRENGGYHYRFPLLASLAGSTVGTFALHGQVVGSQKITSRTASLGNVTDISSTDFEFGFEAQAFAAAADFDLVWTEESPAGAGSMVTHMAEDGTIYFVHTFSADGAGLSDAPLPKDIVFVIDRSGSMSGPKMRQAKEALVAILGDLRPDDSFTVFAFDNLIGFWREKVQKATAENVTSATSWVSALEAGGSTDINGSLLAGMAALQSAEGRSPILVFLSDGEATAGETSPDGIRANLRAANTLGAAVFTLAFGYDADWTLLQQLAFENDGEPRRIFEAQDAVEQIHGFYDTFATPALTGVRVTYGAGVLEAFPTTFAAAYAGSDLVVVGVIRPGTTSVWAEVTGNASGGPVSFNVTFDLATTEAGEFAERAWAYERVRQLEQQAILGDADAKAAMTALAVEYMFVTRYTSLVALQTPAIYLPTSLAADTADLDLTAASAGTYLPSSAPAAPPSLAPTSLTGRSTLTADPLAGSSALAGLTDSTTAAPTPAPADAFGSGGMAAASAPSLALGAVALLAGACLVGFALGARPSTRRR